ncbi:pilus assembly protein [Rhizobium sp. KVB221]|uniref:Pilus assembly protein n=1 Tax=Rhizobium setariae TaxID=2801340 RepID=A0A936YU93_9HYPH|nr:pilus assembly protein [Rhizobium setariae]
MSRIGVQKALSRLRHVLVDRSGASAVEFAFLVPILLCIYLSSFEVTNGYTVAKKVLKASGTVADIVTRQSSVDKAFLNGMIDAAEATVAPHATDTMTMKISGITIDSAGNAKVLWSWDQSNSAPYVKGSTVDIPSDMKTPSSFLVHTEISLPHEMLLFLGSGTDFASSARTVTITREFFFRQRLSEEIACTDCS